MSPAHRPSDITCTWGKTRARRVFCTEEDSHRAPDSAQTSRNPICTQSQAGCGSQGWAFLETARHRPPPSCKPRMFLPLPQLTPHSPTLPVKGPGLSRISVVSSGDSKTQDQSNSGRALSWEADWGGVGGLPLSSFPTNNISACIQSGRESSVRKGLRS